MVSSNSYADQQQQQQQPINTTTKQHLLSVNKPPSKPSKKSLASSSQGSNQPKVYNVKPIHFRELVQRLTGSASLQQTQQPSQRLQSSAPPPIQLNSWSAMANDHSSSSSVPAITNQKKSTAGDGFLIGDLGMDLSLSPTSCSWFSFPLLSPGPLSNYGA